MSGILNHFPADVVRQTLIDLGLGADLGSAEWPVYSQKEPDAPDDVLTVFDTAGRDLGRTNPDQGRIELYGIQVRVRAGTVSGGGSKARAIAGALDAVYYRPVVVDGAIYLVRHFSRSGGVLRLGPEQGASGRWVFVLNGLASLEQVL